MAVMFSMPSFANSALRLSSVSCPDVTSSSAAAVLSTSTLKSTSTPPACSSMRRRAAAAAVTALMMTLSGTVFAAAATPLLNWFFGLALPTLLKSSTVYGSVTTI